MIPLELKETEEINFLSSLNGSLCAGNLAELEKALKKLTLTRKPLQKDFPGSIKLMIHTAQKYVSMWKKISHIYTEGENAVLIYFLNNKIGKN